MKSLFCWLFFSSLGFFSFLSLAHADSSANWSCKGDSISLKSVSPYLGENSSYSQTLFMLYKSEDTSRDLAYFLTTKQKTEKDGSVLIEGTNEAGGWFNLLLSAPEDVGDGTVIKLKAEGTLSYFQGKTLEGKDENVTCLFE